MSIQDSNVPWNGIKADGPLLRPAEAAAFLKTSPKNYYAMARRGEVPKPVKLRADGRATVIPLSWLNAVIAARFCAENAA